MPMDGARREAVDHRDRDVEAIGAIRQSQGVECALRRLVEPSSKVWSLQVGGAVRRGTPETQRRQAQRRQVRPHARDVERVVHRVTGACMRELKGELRRRRQTHAGSAEPDVRRGEPSQRTPGVG